jgi:hypothetical protein
MNLFESCRFIEAESNSDQLPTVLVIKGVYTSAASSTNVLVGVEVCT